MSTEALWNDCLANSDHHLYEIRASRDELYLRNRELGQEGIHFPNGIQDSRDLLNGKSIELCEMSAETFAQLSDILSAGEVLRAE